MKIKFCGAAKTVTGSCTLVEAAGRKFLVDCGMFQGKDFEQNEMDFPFNPEEIDFVVITHAHIDHTGRLPLLVNKGFKGMIYCTSATADLINIMLKDSAHIQELETSSKNKKRLRKGLEPLKPLYTVKDAEEVSELICGESYDNIIKIDDNISIIFKDAGHLIGSSIIELSIIDEKAHKIVFSGDLGNFNIPIIRDSEFIDDADFLVIESTYGNRLHTVENETEKLYDTIINTIKKGGNVLIPSFAVGRTQEILYILNYYTEIEKRKDLKNVEIYLDSPLAQEATRVFSKHKECYDDEALKTLEIDNHLLDFPNLHITSLAKESMELNNKSGVVIISSSGMCEAGRIKHHLKHNLWNPKCAVAFVGYQAEGTLGRRILNGEKTVKIYGEEIAVKAQIINIPGLSGHADMNGLINWVKHTKYEDIDKIFINHGEEEAANNLKNELMKFCSCNILIPDMLNEYIL